MHYFYLSLILFVITAEGLLAQCPPGSVYFSTQAEIDAFAATYPNCAEIAGSLSIGAFSDSTDITNLNGLAAITSVSGELEIRNSSGLTSLAGLDAITSVNGQLVISDNDLLTSLAGLEALTSIEGNLNIRLNDALTSLMSLEALTSINGSLDIFRNNALTSLTGFEALTSIGGATDISRNDALTSLTGLEALTSIGEDLFISSNAVLTSLTGLDELTSVSGSMGISFNGALTSLTGLNSLTSIGGSLTIVLNNALTSLTGLDGTTSVSSLIIINNDLLMSLNGLENIDPTGIAVLTVSGNPQLSTCSVESICAYLEVEMNSANIFGNATGCNSRTEVEMACVVSTTSISETDIELFPNPTSDRLQWRNVSAERVEVFTAEGQRVIQQISPDSQLDISALPVGVYVVHLITTDAVYASRIVKK